MSNMLNHVILFIVFSVTAIIYASTEHMPHLIMNQIVNNSSYELVLTDRVNNFSMTIANGQSMELNSEIKGSKNIVILGSMIDCMQNQAQFTLKPANPKQGHFDAQQSYFNICAMPGGIDDGSRMITGTLGSIVVKCFMASIKGGCIVNTSRLKKPECSVVKIDLYLTSKDQDMQQGLFKIYGSFTLKEE